MEEIKLIKKDLIFLGKEFKDKKEAITFLTKNLRMKGYVKESYEEALLEREENYPTGLDTEKIKVAIPHTDAVHVEKPAIAVMTLKEPIMFQNMADPSESLPVKLIFMLAVKDPKEQVPLLTKLMSIFSEADILETIYQINTTEDMKIKLETVLYKDGE